MGGLARGTIVETTMRGEKVRARIEFRVERGEPLGEYSLYRLDGGGRFVACVCKLRIVEEPKEVSPQRKEKL